jgi:Protein of unknown function (DUF3263)
MHTDSDDEELDEVMEFAHASAPESPNADGAHTPSVDQVVGGQVVSGQVVSGQVVGGEVSGDGQVSVVGLSPRDREILAFERQWWKYAGAKEQAIRELFGMSGTRYYQVLNTLIDTAAALAADPMLVKRLRRLRTSRQRQRSARRLGIDV